jgi:hypothetical protein
MLKKHGVVNTFGGGYNGQACTKLLFNKNNIKQDLETLMGRSLDNHFSVLNGYQYIHSVMSKSTFSPVDIAKLNADYNTKYTTFEEVVTDYELRCLK